MFSASKPADKASPAWSIDPGTPPVVAGLGAMLRLFRDSPLPSKTPAELLPEAAQIAADFRASPRVQRFRQLVAEISQVERSVTDSECGQNELEDLLTDAAIEGADPLAE